MTAGASSQDVFARVRRGIPKFEYSATKRKDFAVAEPY